METSIGSWSWLQALDENRGARVAGTWIGSIVLRHCEEIAATSNSAF
jgi:hypothetical protein